jgi:ABC-type multidrug transport system fused ATPase/permease subunit
MTFALSGSRLTQRIRFKAFSCLLRQEVAYFDQPENSSGSICTRLQSDASSIQKMAGTRLGVVCEILAMSGLAFILGLCVSYQLTLVIFLPLIVIIVITYLDIRFKAKINERSDQKIEQASSVSLEYLFQFKK